MARLLLSIPPETVNLNQRRAQPMWGPIVISLAAGIVVMLGGLVVNGCRINRLLGRSGSEGGSGIIIVTPSVVRDSALAGENSMRETNLVVSNGGTWSATTGDDWIHLRPATGGSRATVRLLLDPRDLSPGLHDGGIRVQENETDGASATVSVSFLIQQPVLEVKPNELRFEARNNSSVFFDTLEVTNEGTGPLIWTATTEHHSGWLTITNTSGTGPGKIAVRASNEGLSYFGTFKETIIVDAPGAKDSPQRIEVTLRRRRGDD